MNTCELKIHFDSQPNPFKLSSGTSALCIILPADFCIAPPISPSENVSVLFSFYLPSFHLQGEIACSIFYHFSFFFINPFVSSEHSSWSTNQSPQLFLQPYHLLTLLSCLFASICCGDPILTLNPDSSYVQVSLLGIK